MTTILKKCDFHYLPQWNRLGSRQIWILDIIYYKKQIIEKDEQVKELYKEMKTLKYLDTDKITFGTYYQALLLS